MEMQKVFRWTQSNWARRDIDWFDGGQLAGSLKFASGLLNYARAVVTGRTLRLNRNGFWQMHIHVQVPELEREEAIFESRGFWGGGELRLASGLVYTVHPSAWGNRVELRLTDGTPVLRLTSGGFWKQQGDVFSALPPARAADLPLLTLFTLYFLRLTADDALMAAMVPILVVLMMVVY